MIDFLVVFLYNDPISDISIIMNKEIYYLSDQKQPGSDWQMEAIQNKIIEEMPLGYALHQFIKDDKGVPCDYRYLKTNALFETYTGLLEDEILNRKVTEILPTILEDSFDWIGTYAKVAYEQERLQFEQYSLPLDKWYRIYAYSPMEGFFVTLIEDISEDKYKEQEYFEAQKVIERQEIIIELHQSSLTEPQVFLDQVLNGALKMVESQYGYIFLYSENEKAFTLNTWTNGVVEDCQVMDPQTIYELEKTGVWGEVVRQRKPIVLNEFHKQHPLKKGYPEGHVSLKTFMSVPVFSNGEIVAVVGLANKQGGYSEYDVNQLTMLMQGAWLILEARSEKMKSEKAWYQFGQILNQLPILFCEFNEEGTLQFVNDRFCEFFDKERKDLIGESYLKVIPENQKDDIRDRMSKLSLNQPIVDYIHQVESRGDLRWLEWQNMAIYDDRAKVEFYFSIGTDITDRRRQELEEQEELARLRAAFENHRAVIFFIDPDTGRFLYANPAASAFYGYSREELLQMTIFEINMQDDSFIRNLGDRIFNRELDFFTVPHRLKSGDIKIVDVFSSPIDYQSRKVLFSIIFDVTEKEKAMKEIKQLAYFDYLTGIYNRRYFEESFRHLNKEENYPLAILLGDINGLKMVNDNYGSRVGDALIKVAVKEIQQLIPSNSFFARIGGDEFVILITQGDEEEVLAISDRLELELEKNIQIDGHRQLDLYLSVSFGHAIQEEHRHSMDDLIKQAENHIYKRKYYNAKSMRSHMIKAMMTTLFQKSEREQKHSERVGNYCEAIAKALNWDLERTNQVKAAGNLHDIGKIGIDGNILNKPGKLNAEEWEIMQQHASKSAKILEEIEEYEAIAQHVAAHHERLDGRGYPMGLKEKDISPEAKIIAVADAYDAMTEYRTYRKAMSKEEAIQELYRCAGTQFDPEIVQIFVEQVIDTM